mgnify:CR=1 FL=1
MLALRSEALAHSLEIALAGRAHLADRMYVHVGLGLSGVL